MAEMTTLTSAIYRRYQTCPAPGYENVTPGITSRFEVFYDDQVSEMRVSSPSLYSSQHVFADLLLKEHCCLIKFNRLGRPSSIRDP